MSIFKKKKEEKDVFDFGERSEEFKEINRKYEAERKAGKLWRFRMVPDMDGSYKLYRSANFPRHSPAYHFTEVCSVKDEEEAREIIKNLSREVIEL